MRIFIGQLFLIFTFVLGQNTGYSDAFINIGASSRSIGLGQSVVALPNNIGGYTVNPSATAEINKYTINGMYVNQFEMAEYFSVGFTYPSKSGYQLGIYGLNLSVDNIFERPDINNISNLETRRDSIRRLIAQGYKSFSTRESALFFNISKNIEKMFESKKHSKYIPMNFPIGLNIKIIQKDLYRTQGKGIGIDLGGMMHADIKNIINLNWIDEIVVGLSLTNLINTTIYWDSGDKDYIPMQFIAGIGYFHTFDHLPLKYNLLWQNNSLNPRESQLGIELIIFDLINIRGGYNYGYIQGGIGLKFSKQNYSIGLDYSFSDHDLGNAHRIGGWVSF